MKLSTAREAYYAASGTASTVARQAAFAGIAVVWLFNIRTAQGFTLPVELLLAVFCFVLMLFTDLLHYFVQAVIWGTVSRHQEKKRDRERNSTGKGRPKKRPDDDGDDYEFDASPSLNWPTLCFFGIKFVLLAFGYGVLVHFLWGALTPRST